MKLVQMKGGCFVKIDFRTFKGNYSIVFNIKLGGLDLRKTMLRLQAVCL